MRVCAHFYPGAYTTFNVFPPGKPGIVSSGNNLAENAASGSNVEGLEQTARPLVHAPNEELHQHALSLHSENAIKINKLSQEQLNVFENQPPDLQAQSLQLFKDYGPARPGVMTHQGLDNQITQS